jgi:hypothetical protein
VTYPRCSYAGCRAPVFRCVSWAGGLAFCRNHLAVFHGAEAPVPGEAPPEAPRLRSGGESLAPPPEAPARQGSLALTDPPRAN